MLLFIVLFAFTFVTKNKLALAKTVTKGKYYRNASNKFEYRFFIAISLMFNNATIVWGARKKHNNNIILILHFVTFLLIFSEVATVDILCTSLDVRTVLT